MIDSKKVKEIVFSLGADLCGIVRLFHRSMLHRLQV